MSHHTNTTSKLVHNHCITVCPPGPELKAGAEEGGLLQMEKLHMVMEEEQLGGGGDKHNMRGFIKLY